MGVVASRSLSDVIMGLGAATLPLDPLEYREKRKLGGVPKGQKSAPFSFAPYSIYLKMNSSPTKMIHLDGQGPRVPPWVQDHLLGSQHWFPDHLIVES